METRTDVLVVGGGLGGVAAAMAAVESGLHVLLTEETAWMGGQLTAQAVPPDEHPWIERTGGSASYRELRARIRRYYRANYPLTEAAARRRHLNPGSAWVSPLAHEPRVGLAAIDSMLQAARSTGRLVAATDHVPTSVVSQGDRISAVTFLDRVEGTTLTVMPRLVIDSSETGTVLELGAVEHVTGSESASDTGEPHGSSTARPHNMQAVTHCLAVDHVAGTDHTIERPPSYAHWSAVRDRWSGHPLLGWTATNPRTLEPVTYPFDPEADAGDDGSHLRGVAPGAKDLWSYRRILARRNLRPGVLDGDISIINWPQNDYLDGPLFGIDADASARSARESRDLTACLLYWLQTEAPRPDGGTGFPGLRPRGDVTGTPDGMALQPYIRESRRALTETIVREQDISQAARGSRGAVHYPDTVGTGYYRIDLHPTTEGDTFLDIPTHPYEVPLGALLPIRVDNLICGGKNIGTTHISNGCYRVHPTEWLVGEVAGQLAAVTLGWGVTPRAVRADRSRLEVFQDRLASTGITLRWPSWVEAPRG